ncbi:MAG: DUF4097 domain-containing protein [Puniceicoccaceae bacterium]
MKTLKPITVLTLIAVAAPGFLSAKPFTREIIREFDSGSIQKVDLQAQSANVGISSWDRDKVVVDVELTANASDQAEADEIFDEAEVSITENAGVLEVVVKTKSKSGSMFGIFGGSNSSRANITVNVPENMDLHLKNGSGNVAIDDITGVLVFTSGSGNVSGSNLTGDVKAKSGSGDINLVAVQGNIIVGTGSGSVKVSDMEGSLDAATGSGDVKANGQISQFTAKTGSGSVRIESSVELVDDSKAATGSGDVKILLPASAGFELDAGVGSGSISCDFDLVDPVAKKRSLKGATANGGPSLKIGTGSGSIRVGHN